MKAKVEVCHLPKDEFFEFNTRRGTGERLAYARECFEFDKYKKVLETTMENPTFDEVYRATQSLETPWWESFDDYDVIRYTRSTSIGDMIVINGESKIVDSYGFMEFTSVTILPQIQDNIKRSSSEFVREHFPNLHFSDFEKLRDTVVHYRTKDYIRKVTFEEAEISGEEYEDV